VLLADGAINFNLIASVDGVKRAGCWAYARRKFFEAREANRRMRSSRWPASDACVPSSADGSLTQSRRGVDARSLDLVELGC
jgi:hypothetical protein